MSCWFQLRVRAYDNGIPVLDDVQLFTITIDRNLFAPVFFPTVIFTSTVIETARLNDPTEVKVRVDAIDEDTQVGLVNIRVLYHTDFHIVLCVLSKQTRIIRVLFY